MTMPGKITALATLLLSFGALALPAVADDGMNEIPEPPKHKTTLEPIDKSFSQLLNEGYQIIDFQFEKNDAAFVIVRGGHNVLCMVDQNGTSQCMGLN